MRNTAIGLIIKVIDFYRLLFGLMWKFKPLPIYYLPCNFYPTCSEYSQIAICKHGIFKGIWMSFARIMRCNPFNKGGYDPVK